MDCYCLNLSLRPTKNYRNNLNQTFSRTYCNMFLKTIVLQPQGWPTLYILIAFDRYQQITRNIYFILLYSMSSKVFTAFQIAIRLNINVSVISAKSLDVQSGDEIIGLRILKGDICTINQLFANCDNKTHLKFYLSS